jgi:hypothetical protein
MHTLDLRSAKPFPYPFMNSGLTSVAARRLGRIGFALALFLAAAGAALAQSCPPGYYSPDGLDDEEVICSPGYYTSGFGMTSPTPAPPGFYVQTYGATSATICPGGFYATGPAAVTPTQCPAGYYAPEGSSEPTLCPVGHYAPVQSSAPITCVAGYFAPNTGMSSPVPAAPGYYVPGTGASSQIICPAGYYASNSATVNPTICPAGYFASQGSILPTICPAGYFVPSPGASNDLPDPPGTWSHPGSAVVRSASLAAPRSASNHIVGPIYFATLSSTIDLSSGPVSLTASNASTDLGVADTLTGLSVLSATLSGGDAADFQISGPSPGTVLYEKSKTKINLSVVNPPSLGVGTYSTTLIVQTDQSAPFASPGDSFNYTVTFIVPPPTLTIALADPTDVVLTWPNTNYTLQTATDVSGVYTNIPGATSPHTNAITPGNQFFRLIHQ